MCDDRPARPRRTCRSNLRPSQDAAHFRSVKRSFATTNWQFPYPREYGTLNHESQHSFVDFDYSSARTGLTLQNSSKPSIQSRAGIPQFGRTAKILASKSEAAANELACCRVPASSKMKRLPSSVSNTKPLVCNSVVVSVMVTTTNRTPDNVQVLSALNCAR